MPPVLRLPLQAPDAVQPEASVESQFKTADCPTNMLDEETYRLATGAGAGIGSAGGSGVVPVANPVPESAEASKLSSVLHAVSTSETNRIKKLLDNTG